MITISTDSAKNKSIFLLMFIVLFVAILMGAGIGVGAYIYAAPLALLIPATYLLFRPAISVVIYVTFSLLVAGSLKYFFGLNIIQWVLSVIGLMILSYSLIKIIFTVSTVHIPANGISQLMLLWWIVIIFTSVANLVSFSEWIVGLRIYLPVFGIFAYLAYCNPSERLLKGIFFFMMLTGSIQWIFSLYQHLEVMPIRIALNYPGSPYDSVVGSFGGEKYGGGESGSLGIYLSIMIILSTALFKFSQLKKAYFITLLLACFGGVALIESKVVILMIPVGLSLVYWDHLIKEPKKFLVGSAGVSGLMFGLLTLYYHLYWQAESRFGLFDTIITRISYSFDPSFRSSSFSLGRIGSLEYWWDQHSILDNPLTFLIGHGLASAVSHSSLIGSGNVVRDHVLKLDETGASKLLWESGLIGFFLFLLIFVFAFSRASYLKKQLLLPVWHRAMMLGVQASMVLISVSIFYEVTAVSSPPMQLTSMFLLGYVAYWWREINMAHCV